MESNFPQGEPKVTEVQQPSPLQTDRPGMIDTINRPKPSITDQPWQEWLDIAFDFLAKIPDQLGGFFSNYNKPLVTLVLILSGLVSVYITLAVLDAIDDIPLLSPVLELVGLAYTGWFVWRYLLKASTRKELLAEFEALKSQVVGRITDEG